MTRRVTHCQPPKGHRDFRWPISPSGKLSFQVCACAALTKRNRRALARRFSSGF